MIKAQVYTSFEYLQKTFSLTNNFLKFVVLHRLPPKTNSNDFVNEFYGLKSSLLDENKKAYVCGDFNIWAEDDTDMYMRRFLKVTEDFNYKNVVCEPTSRLGHVLDLVMCDETDDDLVEVHVKPDYRTQNFHKTLNFKSNISIENKKNEN